MQSALSRIRLLSAKSIVKISPSPHQSEYPQSRTHTHKRQLFIEHFVLSAVVGEYFEQNRRYARLPKRVTFGRVHSILTRSICTAMGYSLSTYSLIGEKYF